MTAVLSQPISVSVRIVSLALLIAFSLFSVWSVSIADSPALNIIPQQAVGYLRARRMLLSEVDLELRHNALVVV